MNKNRRICTDRRKFAYTAYSPERRKGERRKMEPDLLNLIIIGHYSDWFFDIVLTNITLSVKNNLSLLIFFALSWQKLSKYTKTKWDDRASNWLVNRLMRQKKENGGVIPKNPKEERK